MITNDLYSFAYFPNWLEQLDMLAEMALPEPWRYRAGGYERRNTRTPILEQYLKSVFRVLSIMRETAQSPAAANEYLLISSGFALFNTGLLNRYFKPIYAHFLRSTHRSICQDWYFKGFVDESASSVRHINPLPKRPFHNIGQEAVTFYSDLPIRVNAAHILQTPENLERIPQPLRAFRNLPLLLETGVEQMRRLASIMPGIIVTQLYQGSVQYLAPVYLSDPDVADLAMALSYVDGHYQCLTCLTPQMAYSNARLLARPTAPWLTALVQ